MARWSELLNDDAPWWTRPPGVGLRLGLEELVELAEARKAGTVARAAVTPLLGFAHTSLLSPGAYCGSRYPEVADSLRKALNRPDPGDWLVAGGAGPAAVEAALRLIAETPYVERLVDDLCEAAANVKPLGGNPPVTGLSALEPLVELLDAELVYDGHSVAWRRTVLKGVQASHESGNSLAEAIKAALVANRHGETRVFSVLIAVAEEHEPPMMLPGLTLLDPTAAAEQVIRKWECPGVAELLAEPRLGTAVKLARYDETATDPVAAVEGASASFQRHQDLWQLQGGSLSPGNVAFVYDPAGKAEVISLPAERLRLLPEGLVNYEFKSQAGDGPSTFDDALMQLARATSATPASALVSIWTAAETLFGGSAADINAEVSHVLGGMAQLLYLRHLLAWLADRYTRAGVDPDPALPKDRWALDYSVAATGELLKTLDMAGDTLGWWRLKTITRWDRGEVLGSQLMNLGSRFEQVATRAYLLRNMFVHRGAARHRAIAATLPPFAGVVRECVGYASSEPEKALTRAKLAAFRVSHTVSEVKGGMASGEAAVGDILRDRRAGGPPAGVSQPVPGPSPPPPEASAASPVRERQVSAEELSVAAKQLTSEAREVDSGDGGEEEGA
jgi:hypothetical protein